MLNPEAPVVVRALRTVQGANTTVFAFFAPGNLITRIAEISRIARNDQGQLQGFQRREIQAHVKSIQDYLDQGNIIFPNAIILAFSEEPDFRSARGRDPDGLCDVAQIGTLYIPVREGGRSSAWIVDGQQRSLALARSQNSDLPVPVVGFVAPYLETQREQFILVNKARPLPPRLINELLPEVDTRLPKDLALRQVPSKLCDLLNRDPRSPFHDLIRRPSSEGEGSPVVTDSALIEAIRRSINDPLGALARHKGTGSRPADVEGMYRTLLDYWSAVRETFPDAWGRPPTETRLMHSAGIRAMGTLMDLLVARARMTSDPTATLKKALGRIAPSCHWTSGTWEDLGLAWNEVQNVSRHVKGLTEQLIKLDDELNRRPPE